MHERYKGQFPIKMSQLLSCRGTYLLYYKLRVLYKGFICLNSMLYYSKTLIGTELVIICENFKDRVTVHLLIKNNWPFPVHLILKNNWPACLQTMGSNHKNLLLLPISCASPM